MATRFSEGRVAVNLPWGVIVSTSKGYRLVSNGLNQRIPTNARVLVAENDAGLKSIIGRERPT